MRKPLLLLGLTPIVMFAQSVPGFWALIFLLLVIAGSLKPRDI